MSEHDTTSRRGILASLAMGAGLVAAYGVLGLQGLAFLLPKRLRPKTRLLYAGRIDDYEIGGVNTLYDLKGTPVLVQRSEEGFTAFDSTCPHLGCKVHWEPDNDRFFCPCHNGEFRPDGVAYAGPPGDAGQSLAKMNVEANPEAGVVYLEVKDVKRGKV